MMYGEDETQNSVMMIDDTVGRKILDTATAIISQEGYENLTIRRVAKESGCSNSAIYQRFGDKNALAKAVAALQAKPFLIVMDETYSKNVDLFVNLDRITKRLLEKLYSLGLQAIYMQIIYHGNMEIAVNPFIMRIEEYLKNAMARGETNIVNVRETAFFLMSSFLGFIQLVCTNESIDRKRAGKLLDSQNRIIYHGIGSGKGNDSLWDMLRERGVDVDKALARMKGNKDAYRNFLIEFFEDPDFEALKKEIAAGNAKSAFEYAHGLKGMAANLGLEEVRGGLGVLVEILRPGRIDGAQQAYNDVMETCGKVTVLL